ncbi:MAG: radical SAM family heme chaperone HemW [Planctomycetaceae bacterium]|nr:radical SAM family heme chaperone HemW [Planctomycetaceae bacterium]
MQPSPLPRAAYVHVPFCRHRCGYCDFPLIAGRDDLIAEYLRALEIELAEVDGLPELDTLFFGGGTPTHLSPDQLRELFSLVTGTFTLANNVEFSVEANPLDLTDETIRVLSDVGVTRVSLGAQSFDTEALTVLERDHQPKDIVDVVERLKQHGIRNRSIDLIFGVPGQSLETWERTLNAAITSGVEHVSTYGLTYEKGTAFWKWRASGVLHPTDEETERDMYALAMEILTAAGFEQYEISNFAREGFACRHNRVYWEGREYFGFGPGAARYLNGTRSTAQRSVTGWLKRVLAGESGIAESETLSREQRAREAVMLGLRQTAGIHLDTFTDRTGFTLRELAPEAHDRFLRDGLLEELNGYVRLSREGRFLADTVTAEFL